jgi:glyoxalase family protein
VRGASRGGFYAYDARRDSGVRGAGTVHHVACASPMDEHDAWRERVAEAGAHPTPVIDRFYFSSIYFREPSGVLFEIATLGPASPPTSRGAPRRAALAAAELRAPARAARAGLTPLPEPARGGGP